MSPGSDHKAGRDSAGHSLWERIAGSDEFKQLLAAKSAFVVPTTIFFVVYYFALPVLVGYAPGLMQKKVLGPINIAYLFALSQFFVAWIIAFLYVRAAREFDERAARLLRELDGSGKGLK
jgi:uncharacterized membrane protein (DUF485 family)